MYMKPIWSLKNSAGYWSLLQEPKSSPKSRFFLLKKDQIYVYWIWGRWNHINLFCRQVNVYVLLESRQPSQDGPQEDHNANSVNTRTFMPRSANIFAFTLFDGFFSRCNKVKLIPLQFISFPSVTSINESDWIWIEVNVCVWHYTHYRSLLSWNL